MTGASRDLVNGPEDASQLWHQIDWNQREEEVRRLRQRIFRAVEEGNWPKARNLQKLMLRSHSNTLTSVRRVAQLSTGRKTAGVDRKKALTPKTRWNKDAIKRIRKRLSAEVKGLYGSNAAGMLSALTPIIRGWSAYYRKAVSSQIFSSLDHYVWKLTWEWARRSHPQWP
ncbi:reverse transcriptase N-terminal domain-containing protein [Streptomyces sp. NPDC005774]|uniref:reverse transcriptase N-terminal domain-containing protein n=1 Tax=Streptomyces sp. NPDC005774 TaxID=3364728 RepID=UPI0036852857